MRKVGKMLEVAAEVEGGSAWAALSKEERIVLLKRLWADRLKYTPIPSPVAYTSCSKPIT